jgi:hypothetical protein
MRVFISKEEAVKKNQKKFYKQFKIILHGNKKVLFLPPNHGMAA